LELIDMKFIVVIYGDKYLPLLWVNLSSIEKAHPNDSVTVLYEDIKEHEVTILRDRFLTYEFIKGYNIIDFKDPLKRIPLKLRYWFKACQLYPGERLCFLDCDTLVYSNIKDFLKEDFDVLYTWKENSFPLNTGVVVVKNNRKAGLFMEHWLECTESIIKDPYELKVAIQRNGAADQHALFKILNSVSYDNCLDRNIKDEMIRFKGVNTRYLNETSSGPITNDTHIIHYKAGWHPIILDEAPFTENRPRDACKDMLSLWNKLYKEIASSSIKAFIMAASRRHEKKFSTVIRGFEERGILYSEMLAVCSISSEMDIDVLIESGRYRAQSTVVLARYFFGTKTKIISIEKNKDENAMFAENILKDCSDVELIYGDAKNIMPSLVKKYRNKKIAILFDGPKGKEAIDIFKDLVLNSKDVLVGFFHDAKKPSKDVPNPGRELLEKDFERIFFTDDPEYVHAFKQMDEACMTKGVITEHSWRPWMKGSRYMPSYGPTIAVVMPTGKNRNKKINLISKMFFKIRGLFA